jgi:hypothetical protein
VDVALASQCLGAKSLLCALTLQIETMADNVLAQGVRHDHEVQRTFVSGMAFHIDIPEDERAITQNDLMWESTEDAPLPDMDGQTLNQGNVRDTTFVLE